MESPWQLIPRSDRGSKGQRIKGIGVAICLGCIMSKNLTPALFWRAIGNRPIAQALDGNFTPLKLIIDYY
jgi:hypothetical protein